MNPISEILLFEGLPQTTRGGRRTVLGRTCIRKKRVYSPVLGRNVTRCARFSGGYSGSGAGLGAFPIDISQIKDTLMTGGLAVGGAAVCQKVVAYFAPKIDLDPDDKWANALEVVLGIGAGFAIGKYAGKPDIGAAIAIGPVVLNGMRLLGYLITPPAPGEAAEEVSGHRRRALGVPVEAGQFPPEWMFQSRYMNQVQQQAPAFVM